MGTLRLNLTSAPGRSRTIDVSFTLRSQYAAETSRATAREFCRSFTSAENQKPAC